MSIHTLPVEIYFYIGTFLTCNEVENLFPVSKSFQGIFSSDSMWRELASRDLPHSSVTNRYEYFTHKPMLVREKNLSLAIEGNKWAKKLTLMKVQNYNNLEDHFIKAYVRSIMLRMEQVEQYYAFKAKNTEKSMDWKIGVSAVIDELLTESETEKKILDNHLKNLKVYIE